MAIKTSESLNQAIIYLQKNASVLNTQLSKDMNSTEMNMIATDIENSLNLLYEKIRVMEDVNSYIHEFVRNTLKEKKEQFQEILQQTEQCADTILDTSFITYQIPFSNGIQQIKDRDGQSISQMKYSGGQLNIQSSVIQNASMDSVVVDSDVKCYNRNAENLINANGTNNSRSFYLIYEPIVNGLKENYLITFKDLIECNYFNIETVNSSIESVILIGPNDEDIVLNKDNKFFSTVKAKAIRFELVCKNFSDTTVAQDGSISIRDSFSSINSDDSSTNTETSSTIKQMIDYLDSLNKTKLAKDYQVKYKEWMENYTAASKNNKLQTTTI